MKRTKKALLTVAFAGLSCGVQAVTPENRYDTIVDRNIFRLNPPPAVTTPTNAEPVLDRKIDLSGISNVGGKKKAWFVVAPKAGSKDLPLYLNLSEGQRQDFLEVVSISEGEGEVKIVNSGNSMVLSLKNNSLKPQPVPPAAPAPAATPVARTTAPPTPAALPQPAAANYGNYANNAASYANPSYNSGVTVSGGTPIQSANAVQTTESSGLRSIPTRTLRLAPVPSQQQSAPVDPVTQRVLMEVQQEQARQNPNGIPLPPIPPLPQ